MRLLNKILSLFKRFKKSNNNLVIENCTIKNINWDLIDKISKYDIVFVKMNQETIDKYNIEQNHQKRPFLITDKEEENIKGYYMTSNLKRSSFKGSNVKMILNKNKYNLKKNSLVECDDVITLPYENIENYISKLTYSDIHKLKELKNLITENSHICHTKLEMGYITIDNDKKYIIYQKDNQFSYGYGIKITNIKCKNNKGEKNPYIIKNNDKRYELNYIDQKRFDNKLEYDVIDILPASIVYDIAENKRLLKKINKCKKKNIKRPKN